MKGWNILAIIAVLTVFGTSGCYEDYGLTVQDYDSYVTLYDQGTNFSSFKYFIMPDTVVHIYDTTQTDPLLGARKYDRMVLESTKGNLEGRGFEYLGEDTAAIGAAGVDPNKVMVVRVGQFSSTYAGYYYDYWYGYWGWYGWYYPYYPPSYGTYYEYTTGTNLTEILDYGKSIAQSKFVPIWYASISGLMDVSNNTQQRISDGINRTFQQSPYLVAGE